MIMRYTLLINVVFLVSVLAHSNTPPDSDNSFTRFFYDQQNNMKSFFQDQKQRVQRVIESGYEEASKMKNSVDTYVEQQQKKISADVNAYVEKMKDTGNKMADHFTFVDVDDPKSLMETPDVVLTVPSIIAKNGYICETHTVVSQGYILNLHRIPHSKSGRDVSQKTVLLQHGIFASSADWILNGPEKGLAYVLADAGYDVWMSNIRGNRYSREHAWLKSDSKAYWNFSWHDVALHDIPTIIDYIQNLKGTSAKITYIGHSMGTTILFAMLTLRPEYNDKIVAGFALAPVVFMSNMKSPLKAVATITSNVAYMEMVYGSHEFIPKKSAIGSIISSCSGGGDVSMCKSIIFYIVGQNEEQLNKTLLPMFLAHIGTGTSWKTAVHFAQLALTDSKFHHFDYGTSRNERVYGTPTPPEYDLSKVTCPIKLYWAENDLLSDRIDVMKLYEKLNPKSTEIYKVPQFNHLDYLWAVDATRLINEKILCSLDEVFTRTNRFKY